MIEYEAKILGINEARLESALQDAGAHFVGSSLQRRYVYDIEPGDQSRWIRLRDNGTKVTLATKHIRHDGIDGTDEVEVTVDDFEKTNELLGMLGFTPKAYQENHRARYLLKGAEIAVDTWPGLEPYVEIESTSSREHVIEVARLLGFDEDQLVTTNTIDLYAARGIDLAQVAELKF